MCAKLCYIALRLHFVDWGGPPQSRAKKSHF